MEPHSTGSGEVDLSGIEATALERCAGLEAQVEAQARELAGLRGTLAEYEERQQAADTRGNTREMHILTALNAREGELQEALARAVGADVVIDFHGVDPVEEIMRITDGRGVDVAIEALGTQQTFESALRVLRPGGTLSSLGVYSTDLRIPLGAFAAGLGDHTIVTTLCPGGKERMRRLMEVIRSGRVDLTPMVTHRFKLDDIEAAYELFSHQRDGVLKVAITP
jgi:Zn-dependent alcohol dehydrogenase